MKFGKRLRQQVQETLPDWRDSFLSYKELKKFLKLIPSDAPTMNQYFPAETFQFVNLLNREVEKLNAFFLGKEEDFVIRHKELQQRIQMVVHMWGAEGSQPSEAIYKHEIGKIKKDLVDFHGEMILLENYSIINYTGFAKILKKYDKRTGCLLRYPFIQKVLEQPFFVTDLVSKLVKECESTMELVFLTAEEARSKDATNAGAALEEGGIFRKTVAALFTMQEIRSGSSTYSHFSLPPLNLSDADLMLSFHLTSAF